MAAPMPSRYFARGGRYVMDNASFGNMMVSEQLRPALRHFSTLIKGVARINTLASSSGGDTTDDRDGTRLADAYEVERGPIVVVRGQTGEPGPRITERVVNRKRHAAAREFGRGGHTKGRGTRDLRRAGQAFGDLAAEG